MIILQLCVKTLQLLLFISGFFRIKHDCVKNWLIHDAKFSACHCNKPKNCLKWCLTVYCENSWQLTLIPFCRSDVMRIEDGRRPETTENLILFWIVQSLPKAVRWMLGAAECTLYTINPVALIEQCFQRRSQTTSISLHNQQKFSTIAGTSSRFSIKELSYTVDSLVYMTPVKIDMPSRLRGMMSLQSWIKEFSLFYYRVSSCS